MNERRRHLRARSQNPNLAASEYAAHESSEITSVAKVTKIGSELMPPSARRGGMFRPDDPRLEREVDVPGQFSIAGKPQGLSVGETQALIRIPVMPHARVSQASLGVLRRLESVIRQYVRPDDVNRDLRALEAPQNPFGHHPGATKTGTSGRGENQKEPKLLPLGVESVLEGFRVAVGYRNDLTGGVIPERGDADENADSEDHPRQPGSWPHLTLSRSRRRAGRSSF